MFPLDLNVPLGFASVNNEGLRETKVTISLGASHKVLIVALRFNGRKLMIPSL